jgi:multidrug efflux pump subunit AcrA (membrane-fusion protein)
MSKKGILAIVLTLVIGTAICLFFIQNRKLNSVQSIEIDKDEVFEVRLSSLVVSLDLPTQLVVSDTFNLSFKVDGLLEQGELVLQRETSFKKNQLLFQINNRKAFSQYLQAKKEFRSNCDDAIKILENFLLPNELVKWKEFVASLQENQLITDFPSITNREEQKISQNLNLLKSYTALKKLESNMSNYFFLAPFDGKVLKLNVKVGKTVQKNQTIAFLVSKKSKILKVVMDSAEFHQIEAVQKTWIESNDFVQNLDWNSKKIVNNGSKVTLLFKNKNWNRMSINKVFRFRLQGQTEKSFALIPAAFIRKGKVKLAPNNRLEEVEIQKSFKDSSLVSGLKAGMKIIR